MNLKTNLFIPEVSSQKFSNSKNFISMLICIISIFLLTAAAGNVAISQDRKFNETSEQMITESREAGSFHSAELDDRLKDALENRNEAEALRLQAEIESNIRKEDLYVSKYSDDIHYESDLSPEGQDWLSTDPQVYEGEIKSLPSYYKQMDMKYGEDHILYAAVNTKEVSGLYGGKVVFYRSEDNGKTWTYNGALFSGANIYITNISLLVESKNNNAGDSTRLILFYTKSSSNNNDLSVLSYLSFKKNGTGIQSGDIFNSGPGKEISHICAVSDGAYYQSATYIGVVCSESDLSYTNNSAIRLFRSANWGSSFTGAVITTGYNDFYPSADFYKATISQLYIAVERRTTTGLKNLWMIQTNWTPTSSFTSYQISNTHPLEKPCIAIKKNSTPDSIMITATNAGGTVYFGSTNSGTSWSGYNLSQNGSSNFKFTHCYASSSGSPAFTAMYSTQDGDTINVRRGELGYMGEVFFKINGNNSDPNIQPVCVLSQGDDLNLASVLYAGNSAENVFFDHEGFRFAYMQFTIQGLYNPVKNGHNRRDTVTLHLRRGTAPFEIIDSSRSVIDTNSFFPMFRLEGVNPSFSYYFVIRHRNSIETWSSQTVNFLINGNFYDYAFAQNRSYGNNTVQVDNAPMTYAIYSGDVNQEGNIDLTDVLMVYNDANEFVTGYKNTDIDGNDITDLTDIVMTYNNASNFVSVKKP